MAVVVSLRREQVIAGLLVCGVVVVVGYASGFGLHTVSGPVGPDDQTSGPPPVEAAGPPEAPLLPQAVAPPPMSMTGDALPVAPDQPLPSQGTPAEPGLPQPSTPLMPEPPVSPPTAPPAPTSPACVAGAAQTAADTVNSIASGLPVVGPLLGAGQVPQGAPAGLNGLLYTVAGYCPTTGASADPVALPNTALPVPLTALPLAPAGG